MRRIAWVMLLIGLPISGGEGGEPPPACEEAIRTNGWCAAANVGYAASVEIRSPLLYEALDVHGHDIDPSAVTCETCREAIKTDGFCPAHRMGFVSGLAYLSPLTYYIARSRTIDPAAQTCRVCRKHTRGIGWCEKYHVGIAGRIALDDREDFREFEKAYEILLAAVETSTRCETCGAAMVADGYCATHRLKFKGGRAVQPAAP
jgi:hypothetical protein